jgi:flagellar motor switch protein FliG
MRKLIQLAVGVLLVCSVCGLTAEEQPSQMSLLDQAAKFNKEHAEYLQQYVLDKILGPGRGIVIVDVELGVETRVTHQEAREHKVDKKKKLNEVDYLLPGVPNPKSVAQEQAPAESKEETGQSTQTNVDVRTVIRRLIVTVLYDETLSKDKLDIVKDAISATLKFDFKRGDKIDFKKTKFTRGFVEELLRPQVLIPLVLAVLILLFLFGPVASFLRSFIKTMKDKGGTEVTVDSKFDGGPEGDDKNGAGAGGLSQSELDALEREKKKYIPFDYITDDNIKKLAYLIRKEPAQTIALVVSYLKSEYVKEILNSLTPEIQANVAIEMATIRSLSQDDVMQVDNYIKEKIEFLIGGIFHLLEVLDQVDKVSQNNILDYLRNEKPELYEKVRKFIIMFEDIPEFPDQAMQVVIRELKTQDLARGLRNASPEIMNKFFANMSANATAILKEEMEYGRPLTEPEIEEERRKIMNTIKQMEKEGKVFIREKPKGDVIEGFEAESSAPAAEESTDGNQLNDYYNAGVQFYEAGQYNEALQYFEYCVELGSESAALHQYLGNAYFTLGRTSDAITSFEKALALNPGDESLRNWLAEQKNVIGG